MGLLLYCAAPPSLENHAPAGLNRSQIKSVRAQGVVLFYSEIDTDDAKLRSAWKTGALEFYAALDTLFRQATIIPFRYPTVLRSQDELIGFAERSARSFEVELERLQGKVQMEVVFE